MKTVSVIIVNYNSGEYAIECIKTLQTQQGVNLEIIVVDNASIDNSVSLLKQTFGLEITLIESDENLGFGRANNLGATKASYEYLLLLNPDTVLLNHDDILNLITFLDADPVMGLVGPQIFEPRKAKSVLPRYHYSNQKMLKHTHLNSLAGSIAWVLGACMLIKRQLFEKISGFDPDYFLYGEDADICLRVRQHGYQIGYCEAVKISHVSGASEIGQPSLDKWLRKRRGIFLFYQKHYDEKDVLSIVKKARKSALVHMCLSQLKQLVPLKQQALIQDDFNRAKATKIVAEELIAKLKK